MFWNKIVLSPEQSVGEEIFKIRNHFGILLFAAGKPGDMAVFSRQLLDGSVAVYFSPRAARVARSLVEKYRGFSCNRPTQRRMALLAGGDGALTMLA